MTNRPSRPWAFPLACVLAVALVVGAYSNTFDNSFHFDDSHVVQSNLYIRSLNNLPLFFRDAATGSSAPANQVYRPLVTTSLAIDYWLAGGLNVRQFHATQLMLLIVLGGMAYLLFLRVLDLAGTQPLNRYAALLAALLFSAHATATETLNLIHARSEILSTMGVVGAFLMYFHAPRSRRAHLYLLPMIAGALAKVQAVMFAPLFLVYLVLFEQRLSFSDVVSSRSARSVQTAVGKSLPAFGVAALVFAVVSAMGASTVDYGGGSPIDYLRTQFFVWLHYARLFFLPLGLTADTDWGVIPAWYDTRVIAGLMFVALLGWVVWKTSKAAPLRPIAFGVAWFGLALLPASSIIPLGEVANEHRVFFPFMGLSLAVVWGLVQLIVRWSAARPRLRPWLARGGVALAVMAVGANALWTYQRNAVFLTEETLWRDVTEKSPANGRGLMNYGLSQMSRGRNAEAKALFERAAALLPNYSRLEVNLGIVSSELGQLDVAEAHFNRALQIGPSDPASYTFYGRWLAQQGRADEAMTRLQQAIRIGPGDVEARSQLLALYARLGRTAELKALALETRALAPGNPLAGQYLDERGELRAVIAPAPGAETADGLLYTSLVLYQAGNYPASIDAARRALALRPDYAEAWNNIAAGYASLGRWDEAISAAKEALRLKPDFALARNNLAWAEGEKAKEKR